LRLTLNVITANVSFSKREADIVIPLNRPQHDNLMTKRLPLLKLILYISKNYLKGKDSSALNFDNENFLRMDNSFGDTPRLSGFLNMTWRID
tara:strand:+ start:305 stop:580 length:276 start_codon:yes stop_codon:yes gene_type:complete